MKKKEVIVIGMLIAFALFVSLYFDSEIVKGISLIRNSFLNESFIGLTFVSSSIIIFFFLTGLFLFKEDKRKWILPLWFTFGLSVLVSFLLKVAVQRPRPFQLGIVSMLPVLEKASHLIWNFSFPSFLMGMCKKTWSPGATQSGGIRDEMKSLLTPTSSSSFSSGSQGFAGLFK